MLYYNSHFYPSIHKCGIIAGNDVPKNHRPVDKRPQLSLAHLSAG